MPLPTKVISISQKSNLCCHRPLFVGYMLGQQVCLSLGRLMMYLGPC